MIDEVWKGMLSVCIGLRLLVAAGESWKNTGGNGGQGEREATEVKSYIYNYIDIHSEEGKLERKPWTM